MTWWLWPDILWHLIPGYIIYQLLGTLRHEAAHAIAYRWYGYRVTGFRILPRYDEQGRFYFGEVTVAVQPGAHMSINCHLAPYYVALLCIVAWVLAWYFIPQPWVQDDPRLEYNVRLTLLVLFVVSPIVDTAYNVWKWLRNGAGDIARAVAYSRTYT